MPNGIKYSTTAQSLALKVGNFWIGTGDVDKSPTETTGYWNGITPPTGGYTVYLNKESQGPSIYICNDDTDLINITNRIAGQSYTSVTQCLVYYLGQNDKLCANIDYPTIVTNGLVLNLDAGFVPSYPRSGTTWSDISLSGNNGTLINGPTYSTDGGGSIVFDGTNDYVNCGNSSLFNQSGGKSFTITCWALFNSTPAAHNPIFNKAAINGTFEYTLGLNSSRGVQWLTSSNGTSYVSTGVGENIVLSVWYYYAVGYDFTNQVAFSSINGKTIFTSSQTGIFNGNRNFEIGRHNDPTTTMNGRIASLNLYNKVLTAEEILQNYNATKSRFPSIVTNGLVLYLDAGNTASYPGSGTVWTNISGNGNNATLTNGPTYSSSNGGTIVFDGTNDYGTIANGSSLITTDLTIEVIVSIPNSQILQPDTVTYAGNIIGLHGTTNYFRECSMAISNTGNLPNATTFSTGVIFLNQAGNTSNSIGFGTFNFSSTPLFLTYTQVGTTASTYVNGNLVNTKTITKYSRPASMTLDIGYINNTFRYIYLRGGICNIKIYNRALSAAEVLQNYDATKSRFGL